MIVIISFVSLTGCNTKHKASDGVDGLYTPNLLLLPLLVVKALSPVIQQINLISAISRSALRFVDTVAQSYRSNKQVSSYNRDHYP